MDHIQILFKEYDTLRSEILTRTNNVYQVLTISGALVVAFVGWISTHEPDYRFWVALGLFIVVVAIATEFVFREVGFNAARIRQLEAEINRLAGADLLQWETKWGSGATGQILRKRPDRQKKK